MTATRMRFSLVVAFDKGVSKEQFKDYVESYLATTDRGGFRVNWDVLTFRGQSQNTVQFYAADDSDPYTLYCFLQHATEENFLEKTQGTLYCRWASWEDVCSPDGVTQITSGVLAGAFVLHPDTGAHDWVKLDLVSSNDERKGTKGDSYFLVDNQVRENPVDQIETPHWM